MLMPLFPFPLKQCAPMGGPVHIPACQAARLSGALVRRSPTSGVVIGQLISTATRHALCSKSRLSLHCRPTPVTSPFPTLASSSFPLPLAPALPHA